MNKIMMNMLWLGLVPLAAAGAGVPVSGSPAASAPAVAAPAAAAPAAGRQGFAESTEVTAIEVPVQVIRDGEAVRGLTAADFELYDGRKLQALTGFDVIDLAAPENQRLSAAIPAAGRRHFLLIFDLSNSHPKAVMKARDAVTHSLLKTLLPSDLVAVATYGGNSGMKLVLGFTSDRRQIVEAITSLGYTDMTNHMRMAEYLSFVDDLARAAQPNQQYTTPAPPTAQDLANLTTIQRLMAQRAASMSPAMQQDAATSTEALMELQMLLNQWTMESKLNQRLNQLEARNEVTALTQAFAKLARMMDAVSGRKLVVLFSEGLDSTALQGEQNSDAQNAMADTSMQGAGFLTESDTRYGDTSVNNRLEKMLEVFRRSGCVIESVDIGGLRGGEDLDMGGDGRPSGKASLFQMAHDTGGQLFQNFNDLGQAMQLLARTTAVTYLLTFQPAGPLAADSYHPIKVVLKKAPRGTQVSYRSGYYAPRPFRDLGPAERRLAASEQMLNGRASGSIATAVLAAPFRAAAAKAYVPVVVEADGGTLLAGAAGKSLTAELYVNAVDAAGTVADSFDQALRLDLDRVGPALRETGLKFFGHLELAPGDYSVRVMVRNGDTGAYGKRSLVVTVPAFGDAAPVLLPPFFPEAAGRWMVVRELPRGDQRDVTYPFTVGERAYVPAALPVLAPGGQAAVALVGYNLGDGELAARATVESTDGRDLGAGEIRLAGREPGAGGRPDVYRAVFRAPRGLVPGEYRLVVTITGPGGPQTVSARFTIAAPAPAAAG